jgi:hypothetical protein
MMDAFLLGGALDRHSTTVLRPDCSAKRKTMSVAGTA